MGHDTAHPPSRMRALIQEARSGGGRPIQAILDDARGIADASFAAEALFHLAGDPRLTAGEAGRVLAESLHSLNKVERGWRQAEVLEEMARKAPKLRADPASGHAIERFLDGLVDTAIRMPNGQALSKALQSLGKSSPPSRRGDLVARALGNGAFALPDGKEVVDASPASRKALDAIQDTALRARLLAHLHLHGGAGTLGDALAEARMVPDQDRVDVLRGIVASLESVPDLKAVHAGLPGGDEERARLLSALAARADRLGDRALALGWFGEAESHAAKVPEAKARASIRSNLAQGLERSNEPVRAQALLALAQQDKAASASAQRTADPTERADADSVRSVPSVVRPSASEAPAIARGPSTLTSRPITGNRHVLALVDTYEGGIGETHLRAIGRAAPLCDAFGLDLALVGFPTDNLGQLMKQAMAETNIGDGGTHIQDLVAGGHVHLVRATHRQAPDLSSLGHVVATTPDPEQPKAHDFAGCLMEARAAKAQRLVVLMGLGKKGLPQSFLKAAPTHLELTGRNVHLETATAMGIIAERMRQLPPV